MVCFTAHVFSPPQEALTMTMNKFTLLAATAAVSALGAGSAQAQFVFPTAAIHGAGASLVQNVTRQAGDCYGVKSNLGFGMRSWRYSAYIVDGEVQKMFVEPEFGDNCPIDPFEVSDADTMLTYLKGLKSA